MKLETIQRRIRSGKSVAAVARESGVSAKTIYQQLRRAGTPALTLQQPEAEGVTYHEIEPGYRIGDNGTVQSCVMPRTGELGEAWRDLSASKSGNSYSVSFGAGSGGNRRRRSVRLLLIEAFGDRGEGIYSKRYGGGNDA